MDRLLDNGHSLNWLKQALPEGEDELIRVQTDLDEKGDFGNQWVVVTRNRVLVRQNGAIADIPISEIELARTEALVGGARLEIHRKNKPTVHVPYSLTQAQKFSETTRGIEQLRKGQEFFINAHLDRTICESCGRLLPEKKWDMSGLSKQICNIGTHCIVFEALQNTRDCTGSGVYCDDGCRIDSALCDQAHCR